MSYRDSLFDQYINKIPKYTDLTGEVGNTLYDSMGAGKPAETNTIDQVFRGDVTIMGGTLTIGAGNNIFKIDGYGNLWSGNTKFDDAPFRVANDGTMVAKNAVITGTISGGIIDIGGADTTSFHVDATGNMWLGAAAFAGAPFRVSNAGVATFSGYVEDGTAAADVNANTTTINGGKITANSITAAQILANTITTSQLNFSPVQAGGAATDINNYGTQIDYSRVYTPYLSALSANLGTVTAGTLNAVTINSSTLTSATINGTTITGGTYYTSNNGGMDVLMSAGYLWLRYNGVNKITMYANDEQLSRIETDGFVIGGAIYATSSLGCPGTTTINTIQGTDGTHIYSNSSIRPIGNKAFNLGYSSTYIWDNVWADDFVNLCWWLDDEDDVALIKNIKPKKDDKGNMVTELGKPKVDYESLPDFVRTGYKYTKMTSAEKKKRFEKSKDPVPDGLLPGYSIGKMLDLALGAIRQLDDRIIKLENK
jgi:hypothetical protein